MVHTNGHKWNEAKIEESILNIVKKLEINYFPTHKEMNEFYCNNALSNVVSKNGGSEYWSKKIGIKLKSSETNTGLKMEKLFSTEAIKRGYSAERMKPGYSYDVLINKYVKVDVKSGYITKGNNGNYYTFCLNKKFPTCDVYVAYCLMEDGNILKTYIIPSNVLYGKSQLSLGVNNSKYDKYIDRWEIIDDFINFNSIVSKRYA